MSSSSSATIRCITSIYYYPRVKNRANSTRLADLLGEARGLLLVDALVERRPVEQVLLAADQEDGRLRELPELGQPAPAARVQAERVDQAEAEQHHVGLRVGQGPEPRQPLLRLARGVEQVQAQLALVQLHPGRVVLHDRGLVVLQELLLRVGVDQTATGASGSGGGGKGQGGSGRPGHLRCAMH